jgi:hypothetical protein
VKQRVQFGEAEGFASAMRQGGRGTRKHFIAPKFATHCVCCNAETYGLTRDFDPSTDRVRADVVPMPVCAPCRRHAFIVPTTAIIQASLVIVAGVLVGMSIYYLGIRPHDDFLKLMIAIAGAVLLADLAWIFAGRRRAARAREQGHHPGLEFSVTHGRTWLDTTNTVLVDELTKLNPSAQVLPTPLFWRRANRRDAPNARVVKRD